MTRLVCLGKLVTLLGLVYVLFHPAPALAAWTADAEFVDESVSSGATNNSGGGISTYGSTENAQNNTIDAYVEGNASSTGSGTEHSEATISDYVGRNYYQGDPVHDGSLTVTITMSATATVATSTTPGGMATCSATAQITGGPTTVTASPGSPNTTDGPNTNTFTVTISSSQLVGEYLIHCYDSASTGAFGGGSAMASHSAVGTVAYSDP